MSNRLHYDRQTPSDELEIAPRRRRQPWWSAAILPVGVGILIAVMVPSIKRALSPNPRVHSLILLNVTARTLDQFGEDCGRYPTAGEGLAALSVAPPGVRGWAGPYDPNPPSRDAYGNALVYQPGPAGSTYRLFSPGEDGVLGTADDLVEDSIVRAAQNQPSSAPSATSPATSGSLAPTWRSGVSEKVGDTRKRERGGPSRAAPLALMAF